MQGSRFEMEGCFLCRDADDVVYEVVRRRQWIGSVSPDGIEQWRPVGICNYALIDGKPLALLDDGRLVVAPTGKLLTPV